MLRLNNPIIICWYKGSRRNDHWGLFLQVQYKFLSESGTPEPDLVMRRLMPIETWSYRRTTDPFNIDICN
ncbi:hypothetical protein PGT21_019737 [Puccinia graminis f. sp. tritici]|uniref:Uncharacterized protein n=1 Tax=Puccinia graminis f. sp. tritici TaxID=56615 RepID=A0A5B0LYZ1_PUCGR|nr:hypothetical protein PGT21_019737 [Puccinia graminis f. sp. tritici]